MGFLSDLGIRLEKAVTAHFHVHLGFNLGEFLQSLDGDVRSMGMDMSVLDFMQEPDVCDECGGVLDLGDPDTIGAEFEGEDGGPDQLLFFHRRCATPEMISEAEAEDDED